MQAVDINRILQTLPHRYPFLLIDRVIEMEKGTRIVALKNVTINEPFFQGHFPGLPVMPGVLVIEAMAQAAGVLTYDALGMSSGGNSMFFFAGIDEARFKRVVTPGDQLRLEIAIDRRSRNLWKFSGLATCDGQTVATAKMMCALREVASGETASGETGGSEVRSSEVRAGEAGGSEIRSGNVGSSEAGSGRKGGGNVEGGDTCDGRKDSGNVNAAKGRAE